MIILKYFWSSKGLANFIFDLEENLLCTEAMRYKESDENAERLKCSGELNSYQDVDGMKTPTEINVKRALIKSGPLNYVSILKSKPPDFFRQKSGGSRCVCTL